MSISKYVSDIKMQYADIRTMVEALNSHGSDFSREIVQTTYVNDRGRTYDCFLLNKEMTICLVAG